MREAPIVAIPTQAAATITSNAIPTSQIIWCSLQVNTTGSASGTAKLQASNDLVSNFDTLQAPINWVDIPSATVSISGAGSVLIPKTDVCYQFVRVVYTNSGSGTIQAMMNVTGA